VLGTDVNWNNFIRFTDDFAMNAMSQTPQLFDEYCDEFAPMPDGTFMEMFNKPRKRKTFSSVSRGEGSPPPAKKTFKFPNPDGTCPECGMKLVLKSGKYGKFYGCSGYSKTNCKYSCSEKQYAAAMTKAAFKKKFEQPKKDAQPKPVPAPPPPQPVKETKREPEQRKLACFSCDECMIGFRIHPDMPMTCRFYDSKDHTGFCDMFTPKDREKRLKMLKALS